MIAPVEYLPAGTSTRPPPAVEQAVIAFVNAIVLSVVPSPTPPYAGSVSVHVLFDHAAIGKLDVTRQTMSFAFGHGRVLEHAPPSPGPPELLLPELPVLLPLEPVELLPLELLEPELPELPPGLPELPLLEPPEALASPLPLLELPPLEDPPEPDVPPLELDPGLLPPGVGELLPHPTTATAKARQRQLEAR
jgi:hypothetical protein